jgi:hypothetical protein
MARVKIDCVGLNTIVAKLNNDEKLYGPVWRDVFTELAEWIYAKAQKRAPGKGGGLRGGLRLDIDSRPMPTWAQITVHAASKKGFRYPFVLEAGHRARSGKRTALGIGDVRLVRRRGKFGEMVTYQTKSGKTRRKFQLDQGAYINLHYAGKKRSTRRWLRGSLGGAYKQSKVLMAMAAQKIEARWKAA